ncbi:ABC transporter ATP-binding protein [Deinococcus planocerae]|uniref:ABC transporter ATP-binding protein n=1 Tax=Deinococcus planocerae TaxID=1737569 RepID=UPI001C63EA59|nr:ABC transporter ATP-binding protein [Deinococcus planocerae]
MHPDRWLGHAWPGPPATALRPAVAHALGTPLLVMRGVNKWYPGPTAQPGDRVWVLRDVQLQIHAGEHVAVVGPSGSGKSTLMHLLGLLDRPSDGSYHFRQHDVVQMDAAQLAQARNAHIGFVFQTFYLMPKLTVLENVMLPLRLRGVPLAARQATARRYLERVGLLPWQHQRPAQLSGGQKQRVVVARALTQESSLILADEPTGNLDRRTGQGVLDLFDELRAQGKTLVIVTHDPDVAERAQRRFLVEDGYVEAGS